MLNSGTGNTIPYSCFETEIERTLSQLLIPRLTNSSDTALGSIWAGKGALAQACYETRKDIGELVGTAYVARDMIRIAEALDDDGLLRYWGEYFSRRLAGLLKSNYLGFSYGTILGATTAAMFPGKIDRMVIDGVVNPHQYYAGRFAAPPSLSLQDGLIVAGSGVDEPTEADTVFSGFLSACVANPGQCVLAQDGISAEDLSNKIYELIDSLKYNPINLGSSLNIGLVNYDFLKEAIFGELYSPVSGGTLLVDLLHSLLTNNITALTELLAPYLSGPSPFVSGTLEALYGIQCSETALRADNLSSIIPLVDATVTRSRLAGESIANLSPLSCARWLFKAKERYTGDFQTRTRNPLLIVGSPFDPVTPLISARNASAAFEGSVVLQHDGYGVSDVLPWQ